MLTFNLHFQLMHLEMMKEKLQNRTFIFQWTYGLQLEITFHQRVSRLLHQSVGALKKLQTVLGFGLVCIKGN